jgi:hypothetical protein
MISTMWPVPAWTDDAIVLWAEMIHDLELAPASEVVKRLMQSQAERPSVAQIRREVAKLQAGPSTFLPPDEAWAYVSQCFGTVGQYREFPDDYPLVKKAVDGIDWRDMCQSESIDVIRGQFRMAYSALLERSVVETATSAGALALPGASVPQIEARRFAS